jgi:hypothetical protein
MTEFYDNRSRNSLHLSMQLLANVGVS